MAWQRRILLASLAAGFLTTACGGDDASSDGTGGAPVGGAAAGGDAAPDSGPVGGEPVGGAPVGGAPVGGSEPPPAAECGRGVEVIDINAQGTAANGGFTYTGTTSTRDNFFGTCSGDSVGSEGVIKFTAPAAGYYTASTSGTAFDSVLYALSDCNDGFTELPGACNDDVVQGDASSRILLDLEANETVYLFVDQYSGEDAAEFTFAIGPVTTEAPVVESLEAFYNPAVPSVGWIARGRDAEGDAARFRLGVIDGDGAAVMLTQESNEFEAALEGEVEFQSAVLNEDGTFEITGSVAFNPGLPALSQLTYAVGDAVGLWGETVTAELRTSDVVRALGESCDPALALNTCDPATACIDRDGDAAFTCEVATPPALSAGTATFNAETNGFGFRLNGSDAENDVAQVSFTGFDGDGAEVFFGEAAGAVAGGFARLRQSEGTFEGSAIFTAFFQGLCFAPAQAQFQECADNGGDEQMCVDAANASLEACNREKAATIARFDVAVADLTGKASETLQLVVTPTAVSEVGGACDPISALGICPDGEGCAESANAETLWACAPLVAACPEAWGAVDMNANAQGNAFVYSGTNAEAVNHGSGSCGGGGPNTAHRFAAPAAGRYTATISGIQEGDDTLLFARSYCGFVSTANELACNDDIEQGNLASEVTVELAEGAEAFFFVDGYNGEFAGAYTLTIRAAN